MSIKSLARMLESGEYSDLTLTCQGNTFAVHKAIVCSQSPVIAAALRGEFKEAKTNSLEISSFDANTAKRMITFMYTGEYNAIQAEELLSSSEDCTEDTPGALLTHLRVCAIADYYNIPDLSELGRAKISFVLQKTWSVHEFTEAVKEATSSTNDSATHKLLAFTAAEHIEELMDVESFTNLDVLNDFTLQLLRDCSRKISFLKPFQNAHKMLEIGLRDEIARATSNTEKLSNCLRVLAEIDRCRNYNCAAAFNCYIEHNMGVYQIRCAKCRCKHL